MPPIASAGLIDRCHTIDAFVGPNAQGNPAAVLVLEAAIAADEMQRIAHAMGLSETAFILPKAPGVYDLRWFTPEAEVALCGHATLASAWALWNLFGVVETPLVFDTLSGRLLATRVGASVELDFPADHAEPWTPPRDLMMTLGLPGDIASVRSPTTGKMLIQVKDAKTVAALRPDMSAMKRALPASKGGIIVTARGENGYDFVSRYFHPWVGVDEDPVTGSAHCLLATYWSKILGKTGFRAFQSSARGGVLDIVLARDGRVRLRGDAMARTTSKD